MLSVVIPAFNEEKFIRRSLKSLKKQDFKGEYEIIVVDNGSRDHTAQIARSAGVKVVTCPYKGVSYARQCGTDAARGDVIVQADADTVYPVWWLTEIDERLKQRPGVVAVAGTFIYRNPPWWANIEYFLRVFFGKLSSFIFGYPLVISGANFAFYKKTLLQVGGYEHNCYSSDQINIATRLSSRGKVTFTGRLYCSTSERSVNKPAFSVFVDFLRNLFYFARYVLDSPLPVNRKAVSEASSFSTGIYLKLAIPVLAIGLLCSAYLVNTPPNSTPVADQTPGIEMRSDIIEQFRDGILNSFTIPDWQGISINKWMK
ncbi:MAG: glycosyltransferase family 2 protein [Dehalococcoidales bacterium]|nr:glycosyltransferase family 2 protein [Dehalococcoidales bacterium]